MNALITSNAGLILLVGRLLLGVLFVMAGFSKVTDYAGTEAMMQGMGVPPILAPLVILTELGGGLLIIIGLWTRLMAFLLAGFCIVTAFVGHLHPDDPMQMAMLMKNLSIAGGFLVLMVSGAGSISLDGWKSSAEA